MSNKSKLFFTEVTHSSLFVFISITTTFVLVMLKLGNAEINVGLILFSVFFCSVLTLSGLLTLSACGLKESRVRFPIAFVVGFVVISVPMVAVLFYLKVSAFTAFFITTFLLFFILSFFSKKKLVIISVPEDRTDIYITIIFSIVIGFLAKIPLSSPEIMLRTGILPIWSDYFIHGVTIASLGSTFGSGNDMELAGVNISFYHYSPFIFPGAFQEISGMSGLALSTSILLPLGFLIGAFGSYAFAVILGGRIAGLLSITAIICLPAFSVFIQSGWFDFYWLLFATPGTGYALGVSAVVCTLTDCYLKQKNNKVLLLALVLLASIILIRVHIFMLLAPAIVSMLLFNLWWKRRLQLLGLVSLFVSVGLIILISSSAMHSFWIEHAQPYYYLDIALQWTLFHGQKINLINIPILTSAFKLTLVMMAVLGIYIIGFPITLWLTIRRFGFQAKDTLPLLLIASFIGLMLCAPTASNGDFTEYKHRHFTLLYVIVAIYTITYVIALKPSSIDTASTKVKVLVHCLVLVIFSVTIIMNWNNNPSRPNVEAMPWASKLDNQSVIPGLLQSSQYIIKHARKGDVFATNISSSSTSDVNNLNIQAASMTGIPAFISRPELRMARSGCVQEVVRSRLAVLRELSSKGNWSDAKILLQQNGIRWFLTATADTPKWDPDLKFTAFIFKGFSVYDSGEVVNNTSIKAKC